MEKRKELLVEHADRLRKLKLPPNWEVSKLDVVFKREGLAHKYASVVYDSMNNVFYLKAENVTCYPEKVKTLLEGFSVMSKANAVIDSERKGQN